MRPLLNFSTFLWLTKYHFISKKIKHLRKNKGWTQEELARELGVSLTTVQRWEASKNNPSRLARKSLDKFFDEIENAN